MSNIAMIEIIANALGNLVEKVVFVGGTVFKFYSVSIGYYL
jgi:hypothetical protein